MWSQNSSYKFHLKRCHLPISNFRCFNISHLSDFPISNRPTNPPSSSRLTAHQIFSFSPMPSIFLYSSQVLSLMKNFSQLIPMAIAYFFPNVETPFSLRFSLLNLLPPQIFDSCLCKCWVVKSDYESFKVGWTWWPGCCSFLVVRMRGLGVVELSIWFDAMGVRKFSFGLRFLFCLEIFL